MTRVFDLTASRLLLLAVHLVADGAQAEELVQATFLAAIEDADDFDGTRSVLPWLTGILTHRARNLQRWHKARREQPLAAEPHAKEGSGPLQELQDQEMLERVLHALDVLPANYRRVLLLRLVHGLRSVDIAHTLDRSPETVRTQLRRGLRMLREALPRGLAVPSLFALLAGDGLAAVRTKVLAAAPPKIAVPVAVGIMGMVAMKKMWIGLSALLLLAWLGYSALGLANDAGLEESSDRLAAGLQVGTDEGAAAVESDPLAKDTRQALTDRSERETEEPELADDEIRMIGRCVDSVKGAPLAGCRVVLRGRSSNSEAMEAYGKAIDFQSPAPQTTGTDGRFAFRFRPPPPYQFTLNIHSESCPKVRGEWGSLQQGVGQTVDFGDVLLSPGCKLAGKVVDEAGTPQPKVQVWFQISGGILSQRLGRPKPGWGELAELDYYSGVSDAKGEFSCVLPRRKESWPVKTLGGRQMVGPQFLSIEAGQVSARLKVVVRTQEPGEFISGILIDSEGNPVVSVSLEAVPSQGGSSRLGHGSSRREGQFRIKRSGGENGAKFHIKIGAKPRLGIEEHVTKMEYSWGAEDIRIVVPAGPSVEVEVVDATTGEPVEDFGVRMFLDPRQGRVISSAHLRHNGHHPGGRLRVLGVGRGRNFLTVEPAGSGHAPSWLSVVEVTKSGAPLQRIELQRPVERWLEVVLADGTPVPGTRIELVREVRGKPVTTSTTVLPRSRLKFLLGPLNFGGWKTTMTEATVAAQVAALNEALLLQEGMTDPKGRMLLAAAPATGLSIRLLGPGHQAHVVNDTTMAAGLPALRVTVPSGATLTGMLKPHGAVDLLQPPQDKIAQAKGRHNAKNALARLQPRLRLTPRTSTGTLGNLPPASEPGFSIALDGSFRIRGIPPGVWHVRLESHMHNMRDNELASVSDLREGEVRRLDLDVGSLLPAEIVGKVFFDGHLVTNQPVRLMCIRQLGNWPNWAMRMNVPCKTDARGIFRTTVPAGPMCVEIDVIDARWEQAKRFRSEVFRVLPGLRTEYSIQIYRTRLRVRIVLHDRKTPFANRHLTFADTFLSSVPAGKTDANGWLTFDPAPCMEVRLAFRPTDIKGSAALVQKPNQCIVLDPIRILPGKKEMQVELRLPAGLK